MKLQHFKYIILPLFCAGLLCVLWSGLTPKPSVFMSKIIKEHAFPEFQLMDVRAPNPIISLKDLKGKPHIIHVWGTWCGICVREHSVWQEIKKLWPDVSIVGILYRDDDQAALSMMKKKGDPYQYLLHDAVGNLGLDLGIVGTPETFIIDAKGIIRFHHQGAITKSIFEKQFLPILNEPAA